MYCSGLTSVTIGSSVTTIGSMAFYKCSALTEIYNYATAPQDIWSSTFSNYSATLHVVPGYGDVYRAAYAWKDFQTIVDDATDGEPIEKPKLSLSASPSGGDVNGDGKVDMDDATFVTSIILGTADATEAADVNNDGQVGMPDAMFIVNKVLKGKFPDEK